MYVRVRLFLSVDAELLLNTVHTLSVTMETLSVDWSMCIEDTGAGCRIVIHDGLDRARRAVSESVDFSAAQEELAWSSRERILLKHN